MRFKDTKRFGVFSSENPFQVGLNGKPTGTSKCPTLTHTHTVLRETTLSLPVSLFLLSKPYFSHTHTHISDFGLTCRVGPPPPPLVSRL